MFNITSMFQTLSDLLSNTTTQNTTSSAAPIIASTSGCPPVLVTCPSNESQLNTLIAIETTAMVTFAALTTYFLYCGGKKAIENSAAQIPSRLQRSHVDNSILPQDENCGDDGRRMIKK